MFFRWNTSTGSIQDSSYVPVSSQSSRTAEAERLHRLSRRVRGTGQCKTKSYVPVSCPSPCLARYLIGITGFVICLLVVLLSMLMIIRASKELNRINAA